jgi:Ser/Thr protein kinase RdoA (MazF antagonist)
MTEPISAHDAAVAVARRLGLEVANPTVLSDSNNLVVWLPPAPVVVKVATGHHQRLHLELSVARHLLGKNAPAVEPATALPQEVHERDGFEMTFWRHEPTDGSEPSSGAVAAALSELHQALGTYPGALPSFEDELAAVSDALSDRRRAPALPDRGRQILRRALGDLNAELRQMAPSQLPIHGSPSNGNQIVRNGSVRFLDFETACHGPLEWDLAHVDDEIARDYPAKVDPRVRAVCRGLVSAKTATWCWAKYDHPDLRWHAEHHLQVVEDLLGSTG